MRALFPILAVLIATASPALSDDLLDRYRAANVAKAETMQAFYLAKVPELAAVMPDMTWDDEIAAVATCTIEAYRASGGEAGAEAYVAALESWGAMPVTSFAGMADGIPPILSDSKAIDVATTCGALDLAMSRMESSGAMAMLSNPDILQRLTAD